MKYFGIRELVPCVDGHCKDGRCGYDESTIVKVPSEVIQNAIALVENVLDPAREKLGMPIKVNSGYRCPLKNKAVGGVENSQHLRGEAADITPLATGLQAREALMKLAHILVHNGNYGPDYPVSHLHPRLVETQRRKPPQAHAKDGHRLRRNLSQRDMLIVSQITQITQIMLAVGELCRTTRLSDVTFDTHKPTQATPGQARCKHQI